VTLRGGLRVAWTGPIRLVLVVGIGASLAGFGCSKPPPPDPDASPAGARGIKLGVWHRDRIDCRKSTLDCADWFRVQIRREGRAQIDVARVTDQVDEDHEVPPFTLALAETTGKPIRQARARGETRARLTQKVMPGIYMVSLSTPAESAGVMDYELRVAFTPKPAPQGPRYRQVSAVVLEVEGGDAVLIDKGRRQGLAVGQRGRLLEAGRKIADIEILAVYPDGSRAAIRGELSGGITPSTVAEVDVPL
jgi:hypothetical protein